MPGIVTKSTDKLFPLKETTSATPEKNPLESVLKLFLGTSPH